jgi:cytidylate kinase
MSLELLKQLRTSVALTGLLAGALTISACQQQSEPESGMEDGVNAEESVPMSAEPAEPSDVVVNTEDASLNEVESDTVASVNSGVTQISYLCSPELKVEATYKEDANQVVIATDMGTVTLNQTNEGSNPEVFEVATAMDGGQGFTQWRVAHEDRQTGVMRTAGADETNVNTFECNKVS